MNASIQFLKSIPAFNKLMRNLKVNNVTFYLMTVISLVYNIKTEHTVIHTYAFCP